MFQEIRWVLLAEIFYFLVLSTVIVRIIIDTRSVTKTLGYLLLVIFVPVGGMIFYFSFGINYRKRKIYTKKLRMDESIRLDFKEKVDLYRERMLQSDRPDIVANRAMITLLSNAGGAKSVVLENTEVQILQNGEQFFPALLEAMRNARHHIHIQFYIFEDDQIGNRIKELMIARAREGVEVRFIYDDFGSLSIRRTLVRELRAAGVEAQPFNKIRIIGLANRLNYRNHRKIVVIDGHVSFIGGINVSDKYINDGREKLYWRDTHLMIRGYSSLALQQIFITDWNFCAGTDLTFTKELFPVQPIDPASSKLVQVIASGPDSDLPNILYTVIQAVTKAKSEILITTPYYIPDTSLQESLIIAALSGVKVRLLVPEIGDSFFVSVASQAYFEELLKAGVEIYYYRKGFIHAKTFVVDRQVASVGTANMDSRSFDLNFEVSAIVYDTEVAERLASDFFADLNDSVKLDAAEWENRSRWKVLAERVLRLLSPFL